MKIAFLTHLFPPSIGGMQRWNLQMANAYCLAGHSVTVFHFRMGRLPVGETSFEYRPVDISPKTDPLACPPQKNTLFGLIAIRLFFLKNLASLLKYDIWQLTFGEPLTLKIIAVVLSLFFPVKIIVATGCVTYGHP